MKCVFVCVCVLLKHFLCQFEITNRNDENNKKNLAIKTKIRSNRKRKRSSTALFKENEKY